jgi:hypothetical protein
MRRPLVMTLALPLAAALLLVPASPAVAADCTSGFSDADVNGDTFADVVVGDPASGAAGPAGSGALVVTYGTADGPGLGAAEVLVQGDTGVGDAAEAGDGFGAVVRLDFVDGDRCADVVVGVPGENVGAAVDAGTAHVIYGSVSGLGADRAGRVLTLGTSGLGGTPAAGDRFGAAIATTDATGLLDVKSVGIGAPGRDAGGVANSGSAHVLTFATDGTVSTARTITQGHTGIPTASEADDAFGSSLGFTGGTNLVVGAPGENGTGAITHIVNAGNAAPYTASLWTENTAGVAGTANPGDRFGASVATHVFGVTGGRFVAVGAPGKDVGGAANAGGVHLFKYGTGFNARDDWVITQDTAGVEGAAEPGDRFGTAVALDIVWPGIFTVALAVGIPFEDVGTLDAAGSVAVFYVLGSDFGGSDDLFTRDSPGIPGAAAAGAHFGAAAGNVGGELLIGVPDDVANPAGVVIGVPWVRIGGVASDPVHVVTPPSGQRYGAAIG